MTSTSAPQNTPAAPALRSPLFPLHQRLGARFLLFGGWEMPLQYPTGIPREHLAVRSGCGLFDLSHLGRLFLHGPDALALAQWCLTRDLARVPAGEAAYALLCRPDGGVLDDIIAYVIADDAVLLMVNAANRERDRAWLADQARARGLSVALEDRTRDTALLAVQGPRAEAALSGLCAAPLADLPGYAFRQASVAGASATVARTGYTGEDGFELMVAASDAAAVWEALLPGCTPCGLGARDTLRTEAGLALYGHELRDDVNPYEARLGWVVDLDKEAFVGRDALAAIRQAGPSRRLVGLMLEMEGLPRAGQPVRAGGLDVGEVTSGTFSPTLRRGIALALVQTARAALGEQLTVVVRDRPLSAEVVRLPFVPHRLRPRAAQTKPGR